LGAKVLARVAMAVPVALESIKDSLTMIMDSINHVGVAIDSRMDYNQIQ